MSFYHYSYSHGGVDSRIILLYYDADFMNNPLTRHHKKVPEITRLFWVIKILTTAMGEILSDYLVTRYDSVLAVLVATLILVAVFGVQISAKTYTPWKYWLTASMVAVVGTMAADVLHIVIGVPYLVSTIGFATILGAIFFYWYKSEKTLSIHSVSTRRREYFYWATIAATFALGTAAGDMTASTLHLGYLLSGVVFAGAIAVPALIYLKTRTHEILWFWLAYILTRPLGASFADWFGKPATVGGLGLGEGVVSIVLILLVVGLVVFISRNRREIKLETA